MLLQLQSGEGNSPVQKAWDDRSPRGSLWEGPPSGDTPWAKWRNRKAGVVGASWVPCGSVLLALSTPVSDPHKPCSVRLGRWSPRGRALLLPRAAVTDPPPLLEASETTTSRIPSTTSVFMCVSSLPGAYPGQVWFVCFLVLCRVWHQHFCLL